MSSSVSTTEYTAFDILGRVTGHKQTTDGQEYATGYVYNLSGAMVEQVYPSGRVVRNVIDGNGDLSMVQSARCGSTHGVSASCSNLHGYWNYAENFTYNAAGAVTSMQLGNGRWESTQFNSRLQPTQIALGTVQNGTDKLKLEYGYGTTANNGNVLSQTITVPTVGSNPGFTATQTYSYDSLNRLKDAKEMIGATQTWKQTFTFDRYGNRNFDTTNNNTTTLAANCPVAVCNPTVNPANNRLNGYTFDAAGNTTVDAEGRTFVYDAENKQTEVRDQYNTVIGQYFYDGDGKRVKKIVPATGEVTVFVYDASGKSIAEYSTVVEPVETAKVAYLTADHLGSPRINTNRDGNVTSRRDFHPFGEEIHTAQRTAALDYDADTIRKQFTGYERDGETNLDFAQARYYAKTLGRFQSTDLPFVSQKVSEPQTWNMFAYVTNNPLKFIDPFGLWKRVPCSSGDPNEECWEAEKGDTYDTLVRDRCGNPVCTAVASIFPMGGVLRDFFQGRSISEGEVFSFGGFDHYMREMAERALANSPGPMGGRGGGPLKPGKGGKGLLPRLWEKGKEGAKSARDWFKRPSKPSLRQEYEDKVQGLAKMVDNMYNSGHTMEQIAIAVHAARRNLGSQYKDLTPPDLLKKITERNTQKYGDPLGPSIEWLRSRGRSWADIIESAVRPGGADIDFN